MSAAYTDPVTTPDMVAAVAAIEAYRVEHSGNEALDLWAMSCGDGDDYGTGLMVMFAIADCMAALGEIVPGYTPPPFTPQGAEPIEYGDDSYTTMLWDAYVAGHTTADDMREAFTLLSAYDDTLRAAGWSY